MPTETLSTRDRVLRAAADLLAEGGRDAVSTRAVGAAAGVQAPTLYRLFGDKDGLLAAVAAYGFEDYLTSKTRMGRSDDPVADLRRGWDLHVGFGLSRPAFYVLMYGDAHPGVCSPAARRAASMLEQIITHIADAGRLKTSVGRAAGMVHAAGVGVTLSLIATAPEERDPEISTVTREAVLGAIVTGDEEPGPDPRAGVAGRAMALRAALAGHETPLSPAERVLLAEWLDRLAR
ncbi:TetR family transcriptional regulator [Sphaerisporangium siamense]|uniref:AcrR family transcriptional regulator n=1 Tax=Sphaerisporangium siamense TaxID=795645 RepID=A0A7W7DBU6_9ACTN|nr:TetR/AcrR family transcriptional regulator [Sphaerisporangium siamense]MBB4702498.1 AcrR family transcriptional regulator [Sphaerisporangium siamense]GII88196.1 TetR family transcriptional regulator [Sphaerisporangium siamense]